MNKRNLFSLVAACALIATGCTTTGASEENAKNYCEFPANQYRLSGDLLDLVNRTRMSEGLLPLAMDEALTDVAGDYACEMIESEFFAHHSPKTDLDPGDRLTRAGYIYFTMGENLAVGQESAEDVFDDWMTSPQHRDNILSSHWREIGIAVRTTPDGEHYWVQEFADPVKF
jgi:uncharacterized protein YkwD